MALTRVKRSSLDIIESILNSIPSNGIKKTRLANSSMLDYKVMEKYLNILLNENMLLRADERIYLTKKGIEFLRQYEQLKKTFLKK